MKKKIRHSLKISPNETFEEKKLTRYNLKLKKKVMYPKMQAIWNYYKYQKFISKYVYNSYS